MKPLQKDDRIRVYFSGQEMTKGRVYEATETLVRFVEDKTEDMIEVHRRQCVRLVRKKPCPPQAEEWKRRVWWLAIKAKSGMLSGCEQVVDGSTKGPPPMMLPPCSNQDLPLWTRVTEIARDEVVINKAKLAKAWDSVFSPNEGATAKLAKALGLEGSAP